VDYGRNFNYQTNVGISRRHFFICVLLLVFFSLGTFVFGFKQGLNVHSITPPAQAVTSLNKEIGTVVGVAQLLPTPSVNPQASVTEASFKTIQSAGLSLWQEINEYRQNHSLSSLVYDETVCEFTQKRVEELVNHGSLDNHAGFTTASQQLLSRGYQQVAENLAQGYESTQQIITAGWDTSLAHRGVLLSTDFDRGCTSVERSFAVFIAAKR